MDELAKRTASFLNKRKEEALSTEGDYEKEKIISELENILCFGGFRNGKLPKLDYRVNDVFLEYEGKIMEWGEIVYYMSEFGYITKADFYS